MGKSDQKSYTIRPDARYQHSDVTRWCFTSFVDYHRCTGLLGPKNPGCKELEKIYKTICPNAWIARWEEQLKAGTFPMEVEPPCKKK